MVGLGAVSRCALPLLFKRLGVPPARYTVIDRAETDVVADAARNIRESGAAFAREEVTPDGLPGLLARYAGPGDLVIDLSAGVGSADMIRCCHDCGMLYVNTSVETWPEGPDSPAKPRAEKALYMVHMAIRRMVEEWGARHGPTAVLDHGANPGLVSHFVKVALRDIAARCLAEHPPGERAEQLRDAVDRRAWNCLAMHLGVRTIHISERDTQAVGAPGEAREFANTWSPEGFYDEACCAPVEMGWGTHERHLPPGAFRYRRGPRNQIRLDAPGIDTRVRTWVPSGEIVGFLIPHSEAFTISAHLTVNENGRALYRPTVLFAYRPCDSALASLLELGMRTDRRDRLRPRRAGRAPHGTRLSKLVDRIGSGYRGGPETCPPSECHHSPGGLFSDGRLSMGHAPPRRRRTFPRRPAPRGDTGRGQTVSGQVPVGAGLLASAR
jgi:homospermidine synthase